MTTAADIIATPAGALVRSIKDRSSPQFYACAMARRAEFEGKRERCQADLLLLRDQQGRMARSLRALIGLYSDLIETINAHIAIQTARSADAP